MVIDIISKVCSLSKKNIGFNQDKRINFIDRVIRRYPCRGDRPRSPVLLLLAHLRATGTVAPTEFRVFLHLGLVLNAASKLMRLSCGFNNDTSKFYDFIGVQYQIGIKSLLDAFH